MTKPTTRKSAPSRPAEDPNASALPPKTANIPAPPPGFVPDARNYRGVKPRVDEIKGMIGAVEELRRLATDYTAIFGKTAPPYEELVALFAAAAAWSGMRVELDGWDEYCRAREGISWQAARRAMAKLKPAFALASAYDERLPMRLPQMHRLLTAMSRIGQKGASARKANREAEAEGRPVLRGKLAKRAQRAAAKAIVEAARKAEAEGAKAKGTKGKAAR